jgi:hypothetical protein
MTALQPGTVQCIPVRLTSVPMATLHPASTTPVEVHKPWAFGKSGAIMLAWQKEKA